MSGKRLEGMKGVSNQGPFVSFLSPGPATDERQLFYINGGDDRIRTGE